MIAKSLWATGFAHSLSVRHCLAGEPDDLKIETGLNRIKKFVCFIVFVLVFLLERNFALGQTAEIQRIRKYSSRNCFFACPKTTDEPLKRRTIPQDQWKQQ